MTLFLALLALAEAVLLYTAAGVWGKVTYQNRSLKNTFKRCLFWILSTQDDQSHSHASVFPNHMLTSWHMSSSSMTVQAVVLLSQMCLELLRLFQNSISKCVFALKCCSLATFFQENILLTLARNLIESRCDIGFQLSTSSLEKH